MPVLDNVSDPSNKSAVAVIRIMSKCSGGWIKLVEATCFRAKPQTAATVAGDTVHGIGADAVGVAGVVAVGCKAFGSGIESVHPAGVGGESTNSPDRPL